MNRREGRVRAQRRLVREGGVRARTAAGGVAGEEEGPGPFVREGRGAQLLAAREQELQRAVRVGAGRGYIEAEHRRDVVRREQAAIRGAEGFVRVPRRDLRYVVRVLEFAWGQGGRAPGCVVAGPFVGGEDAFGD